MQWFIELNMILRFFYTTTSNKIFKVSISSKAQHLVYLVYFCDGSINLSHSFVNKYLFNFTNC